MPKSFKGKKMLADNMLFSVEDRIIAITGGLGQLGKQFSLSLLERGARVAILDLAAGKVELASELKTFCDQERLIITPVDVTQKNSIESALGVIRKKWGRVPYGLINNAALDSPPKADPYETGPFENFPVESWERVMDVNVKGVFLACQVFGAAMAEVGKGSIINIGSTYGMVSPDHSIYSYKAKKGEQPFFKPVAYSASKSALVNLTRYLAVYWGKVGVRANLMALGGVFNNQDQEFLDGYCAKVPMGRMANEDEYNGAIIYLLSDASSYVTGAVMMLDGGWTAW
jgi:NAD(P)-dependent dehydrogenase (short-subunit alcohol dehydrogenase family)